jgi:arsenite transporter
MPMLARAARHGRLLLVLGLALGIALPPLAHAARPALPGMIAALLFLAAFRVGPRRALGAVGDLRMSLGALLLLQLALPITVALAFGALGWTGPLPMALLLMTAAAPISGSPSLAIMTGQDPGPALRLMVLGTGLLPLTAMPVLWLAPALGGIDEVLAAAGRLMLVIALAVALAFALRARLPRAAAPEARAAIDGATALLMAALVVGLMSGVGPALRDAPATLGLSLALAFAANFGLQIAVAGLLRRLRRPELAASFGISAGNRNVALFLTALPAATTDPMLVFIGCYQIPMYLTPLLLGRFYARQPSLPRDGDGPA